jgi:hypothetical protein
MAFNSRAKAPTSFWIVAALSLLWHLVGAFDYIMIQSPSTGYMADFTPEQVTYFTTLPEWYLVFWAIGVWGAFVGSILLLARSRFAVHAFAAAVGGLTATIIGGFAIPVPESLNTAAYRVFPIVVWAIELALLVYARRCRKRHILR